MDLDPHSRALLDRLGTQSGPVPYDALVASRGEPLDRELAGSPEPVTLCAELILDLPQGPTRARLHRHDTRVRRPLLLWLHPGGFSDGSADDVDTICAAIARRADVSVVSLDYRLAPEHPFPAALEDTVAALRWLDERQSGLGGNGALAVGGQSAGGNLAAAAALLGRGDRATVPRLDAQILCYPVLDLLASGGSRAAFDGVLFDAERMAWDRDQYLAGQAPSELASPLLATSLAGLPPAFIVTAGHDPYRDDGRRYAERLRTQGVEVDHVEFAHAIHAFLSFPGALPYAWDAIEDIAGYLRARLAGTGTALQHVTALYDRSRAAELRALYGAVLGLPEKAPPRAFREQGVVWFDAGDDDRELHFVPADDPAAVSHLCLQVGDVQDARGRVERAGFAAEPSDAIPTRPRFFFTDPFGNLIEVASLNGD